MKNWKDIFKNRFPKCRPRRIAENIYEGGIPGGEMRLAQLDGKPETVVDREIDAVYARCGEVFNSP
jgi:hypothetical protein